MLKHFFLLLLLWVYFVRPASTFTWHNLKIFFIEPCHITLHTMIFISYIYIQILFLLFSAQTIITCSATDTHVDQNWREVFAPVRREDDHNRKCETFKEIVYKVPWRGLNRKNFCIVLVWSRRGSLLLT